MPIKIIGRKFTTIFALIPIIICIKLSFVAIGASLVLLGAISNTDMQLDAFWNIIKEKSYKEM